MQCNSKMITNIQVLRGLAAFAVLLLHSEYKLFGIVSTQFQGVSIFFVISGFIVAYITEAGTKGFLQRRIIRILPIYWVMTIFAFFWYSLDQFSWISLWLEDWRQAFAQTVNLFSNDAGVARVIKSLFFLPYPDPNSGAYTSFLFVAWTLYIEFLFYVLFAIFSVIGRRFAIVCVSISLIILVIINIATDADGVFVRFYGQEVTVYIVLGFVVYAIWKSTGKLAARIDQKYFVFLAVIVGIFLIFLNCSQLWYPGNLSQNLWLVSTYNVLPAAVVLVALYLHSVGVRCRWRPLLILGDISYVLYLSHTIVLTTLSRYSDAYPFLSYKNNASGLMLALVLCCLFAWLVHIALEKPLIRLGKRLYEVRRSFPPILKSTV